MDERPLDLAVLRTFSPLDGLKAENLHALARKTYVRELGAGRVLFKEGDTDKRTFYLVAGSVELRADDRLIGTIRAGTPEARAALAPGLPRKFTARAAVDLEYIMIDSDLLDVLLTWDQTGQYEVAELRGDGLDATGDWETTLLQTKAFHRIPPANIQAIVDALHAHELSPGRCRHQAGHRGRLFLRRGCREVRRDARDPAQQGRHQARRIGSGRQLRRGSADRRSETQCHRDHVHRGHAHAARQD